MSKSMGDQMMEWAEDLFPICRSITGEGVRETLNYLKSVIPEMNIHSVPTGYQAFDWVVPREWVIKDAYIIDPSGQKIIDFKNNNLHVVSYSVPVDRDIELDELQSHLYSLPNQPDAIPYITSYYAERWGFCLTDAQRKSLKNGTYRIKIESALIKGELNYGEIIIPGEDQNQEILLSTYVCHPSLANNELSGPVVALALAQYLKSIPHKHTYRLVFVPETIGSIVYISKNLAALKEKVKAGIVLSCVGDERCFSVVESRYGNTDIDRILKAVAQEHAKKQDCPFKEFTYLFRGSDERQYCSPGVDLPVAGLCRTRYGDYPEYHTSLDNFSVVTAKGLQGTYDAMQDVIRILEIDKKPRINILCEPQMGKRGLYPTLSTKESGLHVRDMMNIIAYCDGNNDIIDLARLSGASLSKTMDIVALLKQHNLII